MMEVLDSGFHEIEHTADTAIRVWAPDLPMLFVEAAKGMNSLTGARLAQTDRISHSISLEAQEVESLLVIFLEEILFLCESNGLGFDEFSIEIKEGFSLSAYIQGAKIFEKQKEIKAVTFHNMEITETDSGFEVVIVFDV
jgi:SHS2 domain-containing protein